MAHAPLNFAKNEYLAHGYFLSVVYIYYIYQVYIPKPSFGVLSLPEYSPKLTGLHSHDSVGLLGDWLLKLE